LFLTDAIVARALTPRAHRRPRSPNVSIPTTESEFAELTEQHRRELRVHCYRMLGSFDEAEDLVQETMLRAWRRRDSFEGRSSFRSWLYTIATNACLDQLRKRPRTPAPPMSVPGQPDFVEISWLEPFPDTLVEPVAAADDRPDAAVVAKETIELAFLVTIQQLPPRQRAVLILRDVVEWSAAETAVALDMTVASVNSAMQRARATLRELAGEQDLESWRDSASAAHATPDERELLQRDMDAHTAADPNAIVDMLREESRLWMPPEPQHFIGREQIAAFFREIFVTDPPGEFRLVPTWSNGQPAAANYLKAPGDAEFRALTIDVLRFEDGQLAEIVAFQQRFFSIFGLPEIWREESGSTP
jgi:RNA polymerase sigma-70 factor, ECF subfamily